MNYLTSTHIRRTRVSDGLWALRHLPHGTEFPRPNNGDERLLSDEVLALSESISTESWLLTHRPDLTVSIGLRRSLVTLKDHVFALGHNERPAGFVGGASTTDAWAAQFQPGTELGGALIDLKLCGNIDATELLKFAHKMKDVAVNGVPIPESLKQQDEILLLAKLVDACSSCESSQFTMCILDNAGTLCADVVLNYIIDSCTPPPPLPLAESKHILLRDQRESFGILHLSLDGLVLGTNGFLLDALVHIDATQLPKYPEARGLLSWWDGFDRIADDLGNSYLSWSLLDGSRQAGRPQHLRVACYPALAPDARELEFSAIPVYLQIIGVRVHSKPIVFPGLTLGDLQVRVSTT